MKKTVWLICIIVWVILVALVYTNVINIYGLYTSIIDSTTPGYLTDYYENIALYGVLKAVVATICAVLLLWVIPRFLCKRIDIKEEKQYQESTNTERVPFWKKESEK